jgi:hypothetical protein
MTKLKLGYYRHYKGGIAKVVDEAKNSETGEIYVAYYHQESETGKIVLWVRPKEMFLDEVIINGKKLPRFEHIGDQISAIESHISENEIE